MKTNLLTHTHAQTHISLNPKYFLPLTCNILLKMTDSCTFLVCIGYFKTENTSENALDSPPQRPDPSSNAALGRGSRSSPQKETPGPN